MIQLILTSLLLGSGLAMDAAAVSIANGLKNPKLKFNKIFLISFVFAIFQGVMPLIGYLVGSAVLKTINWTIPWIALVLLSFVGIKMIFEGLKQNNLIILSLSFKDLLLQAIATSIDALTVGFTISNYSLNHALICIIIIVFVTLIICICACYIGKKFGNTLGNKSQILGGIILITIGIETFIKSIFF